MEMNLYLYLSLGILVLMGFGFFLFSAFYQRAQKETSYVRTGFGGEKVIMDGGAFVLFK